MSRRRTTLLGLIAIIVTSLVFWGDRGRAQTGVTTNQFYDIDVVAVTGANGLTQVYNGVSINDRGNMSFVGRLTADSVFVSTAAGNYRVINPALTGANRAYGGFSQINNNNQVITQDSVPAANQQFVRIWDGAATDSSTLVAAANGAGGFNDFALLRPEVSLNNGGQPAYAGQALTTFQNQLLTGIRPNFNRAALTPPFRPMVADDGRVIVRSGGAASPIFLYPYNLAAPVSIAAPPDFATVGQSPGVSDDGRIAVFYGDLSAAAAAAIGTTAGPGIFASIDEGAGPRRIIRLTGRDAELGVDAAGNPIGFNPAGYTADARVAVVQQELGAAGFDGNTFIVSFMGTPATASPDGLFTAQSGLWTVRTDVRQQGGATTYRTLGPIPVVQVGSLIGCVAKIDLRPGSS